MSYKYCVVPLCTSSTKETPGKLFFRVPTDNNIRKKWFDIMRRDYIISLNKYVCEDHFKVEEDVNEYMRHKILKESGQKTFARMTLKPNVVPHIFDCQPDRPHSVHTMVEKRGHTFIRNKELEERKKLVVDLTEAGPSRSSIPYTEDEEHIRSNLDEDGIEMETDWCEALVLEEVIESPDPEQERGSASTVDVMDVEDTPSKISKLKVQVRSKAVQVTPKMKSVSTSTTSGRAVRPIDLASDQSSLSSTISTIAPVLIDSSFHVESCIDSESTDDENEEEGIMNKEEKELRVKFGLADMERDARMYLGIDPENIFLLDRLALFLKCKRTHVLMVLRKIRLNESMKMLSHIFCVSESTVSRTINKIVPNMAMFLMSLIIWPERAIIFANLPIAFRANFSKVESIIDCFEIEIQKPTKPVYQALTWSDYKKCNTAKYLISCTPDGNINFISRGYGGRASDIQIVKECGYLEKLRPGAVVMADRGFKALETLLTEKGCSLLRPPSVATGTKMSQEEARYTKQIASLRVHVERVIKRVRDYSFLSAHSCFHHDLLSLLDDIVAIACGLSNLQGPLLH